MDQTRQKRIVGRLTELGVSGRDARFAIQEAKSSKQHEVASLSQKLKDLTKHIDVITSVQHQHPGTAGAKPATSPDELAAIFDRMAVIRDEASDAKAALKSVLKKIDGNTRNEDLLTRLLEDNAKQDALLTRVLEKTEENDSQGALVGRLLEKIENNSNSDVLSELASSVASTNRSVKHTISILSIGMGALAISAILLVILFVWQATT